MSAPSLVYLGRAPLIHVVSVALMVPVVTDVAPFQNIAKAAGLYAGNLDGIPGEKTRSALHMSLAKMTATPVAAAPDVETSEVAVAPAGAERTLLQRITGGVGILAPVAGAFAGFDRTGQLIMVGIGIAAVVVLLWRGELIAARVKSVLKSFE